MDGEDHDDIQWSYKAVVGTKSFQKRTGVGRVWKSDLSYKAADFFRAGNAWRSGVWKKTVYRKNLQTFDSLYIMGMERHLYSLV